MSSNKYTLDRFDGNYAIFLKHPEEQQQLLIHRADLNVAVKQGDIVNIDDNGQTYTVTLLTNETENQKQKIQDLMAKLRNQK